MNMHHFRRFVPAVLCAAFLTTSAFSAEYIRVASFNIAELGEGSHHETRDWPFIAKMLTDARLDLIAIEEVGVGQQAETEMACLTDAMNACCAESADYFYMTTPQSGDERCGFIYRAPVVQEGEVLWLDDDKDPGNPRKGGETFFRIPVAVGFHAGDFDFMVVVMHLHWSDLAQREREVGGLRQFLLDDGCKEKDWIAVGDMNRYGKCAKAGPKPFDKLLTGNWKQKYRFPLLEAVTEPDDMKVWKACEDRYCTTISGNGAIYDQIIITQGAYREFGTDAPQFGSNVGILDFDRSGKYAAVKDHNTVKYAVSDHRPVWALFQIDAGDDD